MGEVLSTMANANKENIEYGCVIFDDIHEHTSGYASIAGSPAKRIRGTQDLDTDIVWITNLKYDVMASSGFLYSTRFKQEGFLKARIDQIIKPLGIQEDPSNISETMSSIIHNVIGLTSHFFNIKIVPARELKKNIRQELKTHDVVWPEYVAFAIKDATTHWTPVERPMSTFDLEDWDRVFFQVHPYKIAKAVLPMTIPSGREYKTVYAKDLPSETQSLAQLEKHLGGPFFAKVKITNIQADYNAILNFGGRPSFKDARRNWVSSVELASLFDIADIEIKEVLVPDQSSAIYKPIYDKMNQMEEACHMSLSFMLFIENLWCAASIAWPPDKINREKLSVCLNPAMPFIKAVEKDICMHSAMQLANAGLDVSGYGSGRICVNLRGESPEELLNAAIMSDTIPPAPEGPVDSGIESMVGAMDNPLKVLQVLFIKGEAKKVLAIDNQVMEKLLS